MLFPFTQKVDVVVRITDVTVRAVGNLGCEEELVPHLLSKGIVVVGSFVGEGDDDQFVWMRRFDSEEERARLYEAHYGSEHWKTTLSPRAGELIDREQIQVIRLQPTPKSVLH